MQDLEIRRSMLYDLIERMGFSGLWDYFDYKQRYLQHHGAHVQANDIPPGADQRQRKALARRFRGVEEDSSAAAGHEPVS